jgi:hypothetical protein
MPTLKPRSKSIIFRITPEEYEYLKSETAAHGARSLSDLARSRVLGDKAGAALTQLGHKLAEMESTLRHLAAAIELSQEKRMLEQVRPASAFINSEMSSARGL